MIQLFYDWLEDCVEYLILPEKIITLQSVIAEEEIINQINNYRSLDRSHRKNICCSLKNHFRTIEFEILICITDFVSNVMPQQSENLFFYNRMIERLCLGVTGLNIEKVKYQFIENPNQPNLNRNLPSEIILLFRNFNIIIEFLSIILRYDLQEENISLFFGQNNLKNNLNNFSKYYGYINSSQIPPNMSNRTLPNLNDLNVQLDKQSEKEMPEKEQILFLIYGALDNYFKKKNKNLKNYNLNSSLESISNDELPPKIIYKAVNNAGSNINFYEKKVESGVGYEDSSISNSGLNHLNSNSFLSKMPSGPNYDPDEANELIERFAKLLLPKSTSPNQTTVHVTNSNNQISSSTSNQKVTKMSSSYIINKSKQSGSNAIIANNSFSRNSNSRNESRNLEWEGDGDISFTNEFLSQTKKFPSKNLDKKLTIIPENDNYSEGNIKSSNEKISIKNLSSKEVEIIKIHHKKSSNVTVNSTKSLNINERKSVKKNSRNSISHYKEEKKNQESFTESETSEIYICKKGKTQHEHSSLQQNSIGKKYYSSKNVLLTQNLPRIIEEERDSLERRNDETIDKKRLNIDESIYKKRINLDESTEKKRVDLDETCENMLNFNKRNPELNSIDFKKKYDDYFNDNSQNSSFSNIDHYKISGSLKKYNNTLHPKSRRILSGQDLILRKKNTKF